MHRLILLLSLLALVVTACSFEFQTFPSAEEGATPPAASGLPAGETPGAPGRLEGPDIEYKGIRFTLDPGLGSGVYVSEDTLTIEGATAHSTRFSLEPEEYCRTWCVQVYPVREFEQAFGSFVFPPAGYRGGAAVVFKAREKALSFQSGSGERALETFGQDHFGVSNESLVYAFRGYSADKQYGVYVQAPLRTAGLPEIAPTLSADPQNIMDHNERAAAALNALGPADFEPNLDLLDALAASIQIEAP